MQPIIRQISRAMIFLILLMMCGCSSFNVKSNTVEEISPIILLYLDQNKNGQLLISTIIPPLKKEQKSVITVSSALIKEGRYQMDHKYYREIKSGQLRMVFVSDTLARKGLKDVISSQLLDPEISDRVYLVVAEGNMIDYLNNQLQQKQAQVDFYLYKMFAHYEKQQELTITNLKQFMERLYDPYADPVTPLFAVNAEGFEYQGTALFQDDRMVGAIRQPDDVYFQILRHKNRHHKSMPITALDTTLGEVYATRKIRFTDSYREVQIDVHLGGRVEEYRDNRDLSDPTEAASWVRTVERRVESDMEQIIQQIKSLSVDPLSIGEHTLGLMRRPFTGDQWRKHWPDMQVNVRVHVNVEQSGMLKSNRSIFAPKGRR
jgi:spore germination protein